MNGCACEPPTDAPTKQPTDAPTDAPTEAPTDTPTDAPTDAPTLTTLAPTAAPTDAYYALVASGKHCQKNLPWKGDGKTLDECRTAVLADWNCNLDYFEFAGDANCRCASEDSDSTDCSQSGNQADDTNLNIYSIANAPYELLAAGKSCNAGNNGWKGSGSSLSACRDLVLADPDCVSDYFILAPGDQNCRCASSLSANVDCSHPGNWQDDSAVNLYYIIK
jgi:hypothetical protein